MASLHPPGGVGVRPRLLTLLNDEELKGLFKEYLAEIYCDENIHFYEDVEDYKSLESAAHRKEKALEIFHRYVETGSMEEINIDSAKREYLIDRISGHQHNQPHQQQHTKGIISDEEAFPRGLFDDCQNSIFMLMQNDCYDKFIRSPQYKAHLQRKESKHYQGVELLSEDKLPPSSPTEPLLMSSSSSLPDQHHLHSYSDGDSDGVMSSSSVRYIRVLCCFVPTSWHYHN